MRSLFAALLVCSCCAACSMAGSDSDPLPPDPPDPTGPGTQGPDPDTGSTTDPPDQDPDPAVEPEPEPEPEPDSDPPPETVEVPIFLFGDCLTVSCPDEAPFPVSCEVFFTIGDPRGCVASEPALAEVYFQAGDQCDEGFVTGTLRCATVQGPALSSATCPINKPQPIYADDPSGCPETH